MKKYQPLTMYDSKRDISEMLGEEMENPLCAGTAEAKTAATENAAAEKSKTARTGAVNHCSCSFL